MFWLKHLRMILADVREMKVERREYGELNRRLSWVSYVLVRHDMLCCTFC